MDDAQFKCPQCGNDENFTADAVTLYNAKVIIDRDGWDYWTNGGELDLAEGANLECGECGHFGPAAEFEL